MDHSGLRPRLRGASLFDSSEFLGVLSVVAPSPGQGETWDRDPGRKTFSEVFRVLEEKSQKVYSSRREGWGGVVVEPHATPTYPLPTSPWPGGGAIPQESSNTPLF
ncbi:MAG: hypothetical protein COV10_00775 [Candidatus Vogelbacteria bacterium CG10_big_fil_rev_8_21_14_0_10_51_16]|uniref:Uncharacterized protein n=1 Tax=Candidatus Vogelbacteria bacterium CG10_big_fil_rev_8_21_14_0_10_51_16 TaxID=1975045 RepID=A0A2H0RHE3_9BACT|nr:MAG: hypothetical protein COV10_00775 [Candidatus Vogelbacteria bacterium CG10_big_fil_rev_8_21_14_0_10_51_16]